MAVEGWLDNLPAPQFAQRRQANPHLIPAKALRRSVNGETSVGWHVAERHGGRSLQMANRTAWRV